jgi:hypothetical protein
MQGPPLAPGDFQSARVDRFLHPLRQQPFELGFNDGGFHKTK